MAGTTPQMDLFGGGGVVPDSGAPPPAADRSSGVGSPAATAGEFLAALRQRGATRLQRVRFRRNRTVLWSLTDRGRTLNLHAAYAGSPPILLDAFALLAGSSRDAEGRRRAARRVREWTPVVEAIGRLREVEVLAAMAVAQGRPGKEGGGAPPATPGGLPSCVGGVEERTRILSLYRRFNEERFDGCLPVEVPIRLSSRMRRRLGHMRPGTSPGGERVVVEIALNHHLLRAANHHLLLDTLLHEMAHAADWLVDGRAGHGPSWRGWARRAGCQPRACTTARLEGPAKRGGGGKNRRRPRG
jgi:hypothetical protein